MSEFHPTENIKTKKNPDKTVVAKTLKDMMASGSKPGEEGPGEDNAEKSDKDDAEKEKPKSSAKATKRLFNMLSQGTKKEDSPQKMSDKGQTHEALLDQAAAKKALKQAMKNKNKK